MALVPAERLINERCVHGQRSDTSDLLETHGVHAVSETFAHACAGEETHVSGLELLAVFVGRYQLMELHANMIVVDCAGSKFRQGIQTYLRRVWVLLEEPSGTFEVEERDANERQANGDLNNIGHSPCDVIW